MKKKSIFIKQKFIYLKIKRIFRYLGASSKLILMIQNKIMNDPILYLSMFLGLGGVYVLISAFHDDDDDSDDDGEKCTFLLDSV